jgi:lysophospholipase L1-like esterase
VFIGDSFTEGSGHGFRHQSWGWEASHRLGWQDVYMSGLGSTGYLQTLSSRVKFRDRIVSDCINYTPDVVVIAGGQNDTSFSTASVEAEAETLFDQIKTALPSAKLIVCSPFRGTNGAVGTWRPVRDAIFAGASGIADLTVDAISETDEWITGTGKVGTTTDDGNGDLYVVADGTHWTAAGHRAVGARFAHAVSASGLLA